MPTDLELISEGRKLADELGVKLVGLLLGDNVEGLAKELGGYGADKVIVADDPRLGVYTTDAYTKVICDIIAEEKPEVFLIGATNIGRDLGPRCAARLHTGLCADCTHLDVDVANYQEFLRNNSVLAEERITKTDSAKVLGKPHDVAKDLKMTRPAFGGKPDGDDHLPEIPSFDGDGKTGRAEERGIRRSESECSGSGKSAV